MLVCIPILFILAGFFLNLLAPVLAVVLMVVISYFVLQQVFYFICSLYLLPAELPIMHWGNYQYWGGDEGVCAAAYNSPLAWIGSTLFYAAFIGLFFIPQMITALKRWQADFNRGAASYKAEAAGSSGRVRREPTLSLPAPAPVALSGRDAVAAMCRNGNAATLAKLRGEAYVEPAPVAPVAPVMSHQAVAQYRADPVAGDDPSIEDILASISRILHEDETPATPKTEAELYRARLQRQKEVQAEEQAKIRRQADAMAQLHERLEDLTYQLEQQSYNQQPVIVQHVYDEPEPMPEPEPSFLGEFYRGCHSIVRGVGDNMIGFGIGFAATAALNAHEEKKSK